MRWLIGAVAAAGCFAPRPIPGAPCGANNACPEPLVCNPSTQTCEPTIATAIDAPLADSAVVQDVLDGAPSAFAFRRRLTIKNGSTSELPIGFTIQVPLGATLATLINQGKVQADDSDFRVIGDGSLGERDRIIDPVGGPAPVAVSFSLAAPLAAGGTTTAYALYYGSPTAGPAPADGTAVFTLYDDFETGLASFWLVNDTASVSGGKLILHADHSDGLTTNASGDKLPIVSAVELIAQVIDPTSEPTTHTDGTFYYWFGYQKTGQFTPVSDPWSLWIARGKSGIGVEQKSPIGCESGCSPAPGSQDKGRHYYSVSRDPTRTVFVEDTGAATTIDVTNSEDYSVMVRNFLATSDVQVEYVRARARVSPDPTVTIGPEENL